MQQMPFAALVTTVNVKDEVTDSAAAEPLWQPAKRRKRHDSHDAGRAEVGNHPGTLSETWQECRDHHNRFPGRRDASQLRDACRQSRKTEEIALQEAARRCRFYSDFMALKQ